MPRPDVLAPIEHPLVAQILLGAPCTLDASAITECLAERGIPLDATPWDEDAGGIRRAVRGGEMRVVQLAGAVAAATLVTPMKDADWWDTSDVRAHTHMLSVRVASTEHSAASTARLLVRLTAAVLDSLEADDVPVAAVFWNNERLLPPQFVQSHATTDPALGILVGFHVGKPGTGIALYTSGLAALGLMNIEVATSDAELEAVAAVAQYWVRELIVAGPVIEDGATIGDSPANRARVTFAPASDGDERVYRFVLSDDVAAAHQAALERVKCPECGEQVDAEVMRLDFIPILQKCPACGTGPIALLVEMMNNIGGGEVTVTFETTDDEALIRLLSKHDPRFKSPVEAGNFLGGKYDGQRAVITMQRRVAGMMSAVVSRDYPSIQMTSDEALGMMDRKEGATPMFLSAPGDNTMEEAIAAARASVERFVARLESPQAGDHDFTVKVRIDDPTNGEVEHMWLGDVHREGTQFVGPLDATPRLVTNVKDGQEIRVGINEISDWGFSNGDALHGNYTVRVMMGSLPQKMQAHFKARLVPLE